MSEQEKQYESPSRKRQVETTRKRHGKDFYSKIGKESNGGGFKDKSVASQAAKKSWELRRQRGWVNPNQGKKRKRKVSLTKESA